MITFRQIGRRLRALVARRAMDRELNDEIQLHVELEIEQLVREGMTPDDARAVALRSFGNVGHVKDEAREVRGVRLIEDLQRDLGFGIRTLGRNPAFTSVAVLTLAIGIGGTAAVFGALYGILFAPLPYREPERIITVWQHHRADGIDRGDVSPANFLDWRERSRAFATLVAAEPYSMDHIGPDGAEHVRNWLVSAGFFETFGTAPVIGRTFTPDEYEPGRNRVVVIGYDSWITRFAGDSSVVGRTFILDSLPHTIVGVMPRAFRFPPGRDVWVPRVFTESDRTRRAAAYYLVAGRLRPGVTLDAARAELGRVAEELAQEYPRTNAGTGVTLVPLTEQLVGNVRARLWILMTAVAFVLLIACANVASLLLARTLRRQHELAVRAALGAGRSRIVRQLLTESLLIAAAGGIAGVLLANWLLGAIRALAPATLPRVDELSVSPAVLAFGLVVTITTAVLFGVLPALHAASADARAGLIAGTRSATAGRARRRLQSGLVIAELALALVLLVGAGLLVRSFVALLQVDRGFDSRNVLAVTVWSWGYYPTPPQRANFVREMQERLAAIPGVRAAGMTSSLPFAESIGAEEAGFEIEGRPSAGPEQIPTVHAAAVTSGYFATLGIALRDGRLFAETDGLNSAPVVVVNETLVRRYWTDQNPIGKRIILGFAAAPVTREIIGIVSDVRHAGLQEAPRPTVFVPHSQAPTGANTFVLRTAADPREGSAVDAVRRAFRTTNAAMAIGAVTTLDELLANSLAERRFNLALLGGFAGVALLLAAVGIYGVMSQVTNERTHEMGVRLALGATTGDVLRMVLREGGALALAGTGIGVASALVLTGVLRTMLFEITPADPVTYAGGVALLLGVALFACYLPARRATRIDPVTALRGE
ncbi:MAG: ADOP family duplicated permease [Gemmatimonadaceae bacterium]